MPIDGDVRDEPLTLVPGLHYGNRHHRLSVALPGGSLPRWAASGRARKSPGRQQASDARREVTRI